MRKIMTFLLPTLAASIAWGQNCPNVFPSSIQLTLPRRLPPGSYPFVRDRVALWITCDTASASGAMAHVSVPADTPLTLSGTLQPMSTYDTRVFGRGTLSSGPTLYVSAVSSTIDPAEETQRYALNVTVDGAQASPVIVPVAVTFTDAPFLHSSDAGLGIDLYYPATDADIEAQAADPAIWIPNSQFPQSFAAASDDWLSVTPASGIGWTNPVVRLSRKELQPGSYFGFVTITSSGAINSPLMIPTHLTIIAPQPSAKPSTLVFAQAVGGPAPAAKQVSIAGAVSSAFFAFADVAWLLIDPAASTLPGIVNVSVQPVGLSPGTYRGNVIIQADYAVPISVPVTLVYGSSSDLHISPDSITLYHWPNMSALDAVDRGTFNITADRTMQWTATKSSESWFSLYNWTSFTPARLIFTVPSWPGTGSYAGTITVSSPDASNGPQTVNVNAVIFDTAPLTMSPTTLEFRSIGMDPEPQTIAVSAPAPTPFSVDVTINGGGSWLTVTPSSSQTPATLTVSIKTAGLMGGSYNGRLLFSIPQSGKPPIIMQMLIYLTYYVR